MNKPLEEMTMSELDKYIDDTNRRIDLMLFLIMFKNFRYTNSETSG